MLAMWLWAGGTALHFVFAARVARMALVGNPRPCLLDQRLFGAVLAGIGTLSIALHLVAVSVGLSLTHALIGLAALDGAIWLAVRNWVNTPTTGDCVPTVLESISLALLVAIGLSWIDRASVLRLVHGPDAAHYHLPVALNLALGTSPLDLPATPHLYPMAGSLIAAWFILPTGDPLLVNVAMLLPFLLQVTSLLWLFRLCTGLSGLQWSLPLALALFSTLLFRACSHLSADLWLTAAFTSAVAVLTAVWVNQRWTVVDALLAAAALGLLVGTKSTGIPAAALLTGAYVACEIVRGLIKRRMIALPARPLVTALTAAVVAIGVGGLWLIRNTVLFGSPIAPIGVTVLGATIFRGEPWMPATYHSVLGDLRDPAYPLASRAGVFIAHWLGRWFLLALLPAALVPIDWAVARWRSGRTDVSDARMFLLISASAVGGLLTELLIAAPWSSLEWTKGLSLRYVLPVATLLGLVAYLGFFPLAWTWYRGRFANAIAAGTLLGGSAMFVHSIERTKGTSELPAMSAVWLAVAVLVVWTLRYAAGRPERQRAYVTLAIVGMIASGWAPVLAQRAAAARSTGQRLEVTELSAAATNLQKATLWRQPFLIAALDESARGRACATRRFFSLVRFDAPLALQSADYRSLVFYAGREVEPTRRSGQIGACDYIITTRAMMNTDKGETLVEVLSGGAPLREAGSTDDFLVLARANDQIR